MFAVLASGKLLPPYIVYKAKYLYPDWIEGGPEGARYNRTKSGWFDSDLFEDWFFQIALPALRSNDGKKVIIGDNLGSHLSFKVIEACEENNLSFVFLPKNSTHLCQPLELAVFRPIKISWRKVLTDWKLHNKGVIPKQVFPSLLKKMLANCSEKISANILSGFEATGILPYNPEKVLTKIRPRNDKANQNNPAMVESFSYIMTELTRVNERPAITRKKEINVPSGKSIGLADLEVEADVIPTTSIHMDVSTKNR
ncbi:hypothetical protein JTB14_029161 [Gonioctena quinquepunctata]|nr:hypothetical protein JTB14_029161 [Gonioctena quinquepunctata]